MAKFKYEGATENISAIQLNFIGEILEKKGFKDTKVIIEVLGAAGDNYMANVKRITVEGVNGKPFKMIAKIAPAHEQLRLTANIQNLFKNENIMYTEVLPKFRQLQHAAEVPEKDMLRFAECYGCLMEPPYEVILLEDLVEFNFVMLDRFQPLSEECVRSVLKNLAILHSLSFVLKHKEPQKFDEYRNRLFDLWRNSSPEALAYFGLLETHALKLLGENEDRLEIFKRANMSQFGSFVPEEMQADSETKHTVIQQGDAWTNNVMFKFDSGTLLESIMIDYQISKEASPAYDLLYFIFNCTDHQTRMKHFYDWIDFYHTELDKALANHGLKANYVYPKDQLDGDIKRYGKIMFCLCVILASVLTLNPEEAAKVRDVMEQSNTDVAFTEMPEAMLSATENILRFKNKIEGLVDSFAEFGLL